MQEQVEDNLCAHQLEQSFLVVEPQPSCDYPVFLGVPRCHSTLDTTPVCIQIHCHGDEIRFWMDFVPNPLTLADVQELVGQQWESGSKVFLHESCRLVADAPRAVPPAALIRVFLPARKPGRVNTMSAKLLAPHLHFRDLEVSGYPAEYWFRYNYAVLQVLAPPQLVQYLHTPGSDLRESVLLSFATEQWGPNMLVWPRAPIRDLLTAGREAGAVSGAYPRNAIARAHVFVDARGAGRPLQICASMTGHMSLQAFLEQIGLHYERHDLLRVSGDVRFRRDDRSVVVAAGDTIVLRWITAMDTFESSGDNAEAPSEPPPPEDELDEDDGTPGPSDPPGDHRPVPSTNAFSYSLRRKGQ